MCEFQFDWECALQNSKYHEIFRDLVFYLEYRQIIKMAICKESDDNDKAWRRAGIGSVGT